MSDNKDLLNQLNFDVNVSNNGNENKFDVFKHNQNVLSNINLPNDESNNIGNFNSSGNNNFFNITSF